MNALVRVVNSRGIAHHYVGDTLGACMLQFFASYDAVCADPSSIESINLFTKFAVNKEDSKVFGALQAKGLGALLK